MKVLPVAAGDLVFQLAEDLADLVFERVWPRGLLLEAVQVGEELLIDELAQVITGERGIVIEAAVLFPSGRSDPPAGGSR